MKCKHKARVLALNKVLKFFQRCESWETRKLQFSNGKFFCRIIFFFVIQVWRPRWPLTAYNTTAIMKRKIKNLYFKAK